MQNDIETRGVWKLPLDILTEVMAISQPEAAALMETCRVLYALGPPYVLRHGVMLRTRAQMASFVSFMLADTSRLAYMRLLDLGANVFEFLCRFDARRTDPSFAELVTHPTTALHTLILRDMEKTLTCNPHLFVAVGTLTSLKRLHVHGVGRTGIEALRVMHSQLVSATVALTVPLGYIPSLHGNSAFSDVFSALQSSADTLRELDLSLGTPINPTRDVPVSLRFPHVRTLRTVVDTQFPQCILLRLFPNLENLHLVPGTDLVCVARDPNAVWFMDTLRHANGKIGLSSGPSSPSHSLKLRECSGEVTCLYPLSAHLTASRLQICGHVGEHDLCFLSVVLAEIHPEELEIGVHGLEDVEEIVGVLRELQEPWTLHVLTLNFSFRPGDGEGLVGEVR